MKNLTEERFLMNVRDISKYSGEIAAYHYCEIIRSYIKSGMITYLRKYRGSDCGGLSKEYLHIMEVINNGKED